MDKVKCNRTAINHTQEIINQTPVFEDVKLLQLFTVLDGQKQLLMEEE